MTHFARIPVYKSGVYRICSTCVAKQMETDDREIVGSVQVVDKCQMNFNAQKGEIMTKGIILHLDF
jgi:hypothetical protein